MQTKEVLIPRHIGFILDGNRRWAKQHGLPVYEGHLAGYNALKDVALYAFDRGVDYVTLYAFSTENWKRSKEEVAGLMGLAMRLFKHDMKEVIAKQIRVKVIGTPEGLSDDLIAAIKEAEDGSKNFTRATLVFCFNYGGRLEIAEAAQKCVNDGLKADQITVEALTQRIYAPDVPDVDIIVRTSGEQRLSNFMLWRAAYSELLFLDKFWPEMGPDDVDYVINEYQRRNRRFGG
jgi:undecaprenyl diphosphate synthase